MNQIFNQILRNRILVTTLLAWILAQTIKVTLGVIKNKKFDFRWFVGTGGMPSAHAAGASALATSIGLQLGWDSVYFALACAFAIVVMFDAQGVRRATGKQARILNKILEDIYWQGKIKEDRLRELIGHTPVEVLIGMTLGVVCAFLRHWKGG
ncbi:MAG: divergent PAP2 family protein [Candidatus Omnitrophica bacterium]|nr:divergent PAP2 family protein [Candidatus Omnitrophota bacterium]